MSENSPRCLALRPLAAAIQRVAVYETKLWLYVVGSTNDGTCCRLLKLSRVIPTDPSPSLGVEEVGGEYTEKEIKDTLIMLDIGNKNSANKYRLHGLKQVASAFGIIGFIRFLEGYYIVLITKRKPVATIGGHVIYKIEDTLIYPVMQQGSKPTHPDEAKYLKIFQNVDLSSNFYFSYSYDMTLPLQAQMRTNPGDFPPPCRKFIWNDHMLDGFESVVHPKWILHIIYGFVRQNNISVYGRPIYLTMIARRSKEFAGTRFLKRGANDEGHVANEVEIEQVVHDATSSLHANGCYTSFLQLRGSVPSFWSQDLTGMRPKPQITIDRATPFASPAGLHFLACLRRYGSPVICLNLVKKKERKKRESLLTEELVSSILYLNQFLPPEHHIQYTHKDMARINKSKTLNLINILEQIADDILHTTGFFHGGQELECNRLNPHPRAKGLGGYGYRDDYVGKDQTGVLRVNCVDCLDRTNTAQFIAGKCALGYQLYTLGVLAEPRVPFDCDTIRVLEEAYEDLGDTLAIQYGGSQLVHRIQTYRKVAPVATHGRDLYQTIHRYYRNAFTDADKQMAINVFLGVYQPDDDIPDIWDLTTDYYLHHTLARVLPSSQSIPNHTKWWDSELIANLPLPLYRGRDDPASTSAASASCINERNVSQSDSFDEVYKPFELTDFDSLFSKNITRTSDLNDFTSPFVVREKQKKKLPARKAWRPAIVGSPNPPPGGEEDTGSSSDDSDEEGDGVMVSLPSTPHQLRHRSAQSPYPELLTTMQAYGFKLKEPSKEDCLLYDRYAQVHDSACTPFNNENVHKLTSEAVNAELAQWAPSHNYGEDSVFSVTPPVVSLDDQNIYEQSCQIAEGKPVYLSNLSSEFYFNYIKQWS